MTPPSHAADQTQVTLRNPLEDPNTCLCDRQYVGFSPLFAATLLLQNERAEGCGWTISTVTALAGTPQTAPAPNDSAAALQVGAHPSHQNSSEAVAGADSSSSSSEDSGSSEGSSPDTAPSGEDSQSSGAEDGGWRLPVQGKRAMESSL